MKTLKQILILGMAFLIPTIPVLAGESRLPVGDPIFDQLLSHPAVLQAMHQAVTRHEGRLDKVEHPDPFGGNTYIGTYRFEYKWGPWEAGTPDGGGSPVDDLLGHFTVTVHVETATGRILDIQVSEFFRVDD